ncbi:hypothetical protein AB1Y20_001363 [Prymnesium parvum]|uniref:Uncharacterized protein n=1 Tax=Prymnesium parvum TaxID=97485 RepID=A0AB34KCC6_PRYPA
MLLLLALPHGLALPAISAKGASSRIPSPKMNLAQGDQVMVCGTGPVMLLAAKLAAIKGFATTCAVSERDFELAPGLIYTDLHPEGSLPLEFLKISGPDADSNVIEECTSKAKGLVIAFDGEMTIPERALSVFMPESNSLQRVSLMSRYLNGAGMGFFANAAKLAANSEIWAARAEQVESYRAMEKAVISRAESMGVGHTIIRAGTLKGGAFGDSLAGAGGENTFLHAKFYSLGQQDVVNWRLLYDCDVLGVELARGDTMSGPGFLAAITATNSKGGSGAGESHRGAVATALVEALRLSEAANKDFSVGAREGRQFPDAAAWRKMFANAK